MKKVLILGIGAAQVDAIRYLKRKNFFVIGCSYAEEGPGLKDIDHFELINITDVEKLEAIALKHDVDFIYSIGSDLSTISIAEVSNRLGLPTFISPEISHLLQDKTLLRDFFANKGISPVEYRRISSIDDLEGWDIYPSIVKPANSQGQRGIFVAESLNDILKDLKKAFDASRTHTVILEELLTGPEISANVFVVNGEVIMNVISDRLVVSGYPGGIPLGHALPGENLSSEMLVLTCNFVETCVKALGIKNGPVYFQMKLTSDGPRVIEIAPRLDGCHIWRLIQAVYGIDLLDLTFRHLTGDVLGDFSDKKEKTRSHLMFFLQPPGESFKQAEHLPPEGAFYTEYYFEEGQIVPPVNGNLEKVGYYIMKGTL